MGSGAGRGGGVLRSGNVAVNSRRDGGGMSTEVNATAEAAKERAAEILQKHRCVRVCIVCIFLSPEKCILQLSRMLRVFFMSRRMIHSAFRKARRLWVDF